MGQPIQPKIYEDSVEGKNKLIKWLRDDLEYQRVVLISNGTKREDIKDEDLTLHIGETINDFFGRRICKFSLDFRNILTKVLEPKSPKIEYSNLIVCPYKVEVKLVDFENFTNFAFIKFNSQVNFFESTFKLDTNFQNCVFMEKAYFVTLDFNEKANFAASIIVADIRFSHVTFRNIGHFFKISLQSTLIFDRIIFGKEKGVIYLTSIHVDDNNEKIKLDDGRENSKIKIINTVINGRIDFNDVYVNKIDFKGSNVINGGVLNRINFEAYPENSDTARFLKHEELTRSDTIKALKYKAIEKDRYYDEIKKGIITKFLNIFKTKNKKIENKKADQNIRELFAELTSLWLSKSSNNHGQNWFLAVAFIIAVSFIFLSLASFALMSISWFYSFLLFYLLSLLLSIYINNHLVNIVSTVIISVIIYIIFSTSFPLETVVINTDKINVMNLFITGYVNYLTPTNLDLINGVAHCIDNASSNKYLLETVNQNCSQLNKLNPIRLISFYFFYILGKIAIGYGIFQVIQAFRKFNIK